MAGMKLITTVWRPGTGTQHVQVGLSWADFKSQDKAYFDADLRLVDLEVEGGAYTGVWQPGTGTQWVQPGLSWADFKVQDKAYFDEGLRLVDIEIDGGKYAGVWRPGSGAQWVHPGLTWDQFKTQDKTYFDQGLRLVDVEPEGGRYTGVWRPGSGAQWVVPAMSADDLAAQDKIYAAQGLRISILKVVDGKLTAVWQPGSATQIVELGLSVELFVSEDTAHFAAGLRITALEVHEVPVVVYRLPFDPATGWKLVNGNWDDPTHGHGQGDPNAMQAYAYDITHAEGGQIQAARGGTVYDLDESSSKNGFNPATPCDPGIGNYLVIKHDDRTFGVYWHLQHNGALVAVGDKVATGDIIAKSGNTGNSTGPHLHFDVRVGWDLNYSCSNLSESRAMPAFFTDSNHAYWRPKVGDTLAP
ncbi:MAG: hypothetical protein QOI73_3035 [Solirubrobacteraceae bacterium]|nr:hypothetical protein [Solirubrobacteraceae bacterium]